MNNYDTVGIEDTRKRLQQWGSWCNLILTAGLNFSHKSIVGQLCEYRGTLIKGTNPAFLPENPNAEEVDELINCYAKECPEKARILSIQYVLQDTMKNKLNRAQLPKYKYYRYLSSAEYWINQHL